MEIRLKDCFGRYHAVELPEGTKEVVGITLSGDEIIIYPVYCDPMWALRYADFYESPFCRVFVDGEWKEKEIPDAREKEETI
jgi:hypothetical protein